MILARDFLEYCIRGWDNFPRKLLMYLSNVAYPLESYFHTVLCNSPEFKNTSINNDLRYVIWDSVIEEPQFLTMSHLDNMLASGAAFAKPFQSNDPVLTKIDEHVLRRTPNSLVPGKWCPILGTNRSLENSETKDQVCPSSGNIDSVKAGSRGVELKMLLTKLVAEGRYRSCLCSKNCDL